MPITQMNCEIKTSLDLHSKRLGLRLYKIPCNFH